VYLPPATAGGFPLSTEPTALPVRIPLCEPTSRGGVHLDRRGIAFALLGAVAVLWSVYDLTSVARTYQEPIGAALTDGAEGLLAGGLHLDVPADLLQRLDGTEAELTLETADGLLASGMEWRPGHGRLYLAKLDDVKPVVYNVLVIAWPDGGETRQPIWVNMTWAQ